MRKITMSSPPMNLYFKEKRKIEPRNHSWYVPHSVQLFRYIKVMPTECAEGDIMNKESNLLYHEKKGSRRVETVVVDQTESLSKSLKTITYN